MLSFRELRRAARIIEAKLSGTMLRKIMQTDEHSLVMTFEGASGKSNILISRKPQYARICMTEIPYPSVQVRTSFCEYAQAHLIGGTLFRVEMPAEDRQVRLHFRLRSDFFVLIFSILGSRSNVYLIKADGRLGHSMRPLENTRPELKLGEAWKNPRSAIPSEGIDRWEDVPDEDYLDIIGKTYRHLEQAREKELLVRRIESAIKRERAFLSRKFINLQEDLGEARKAEVHRRKGELLKTVLHMIRPGDTSVRATDHRTGEVLEILLDPKISPVANLESYFARYHKESRGMTMIQQQLADLETARAELEKIELRLRDALENDFSGAKALQSMVSEPDIRRLLKRHSPISKSGAPKNSKRSKKELPSRLLPKRYRTKDGLEIWVGRSDEGNDYLTTRLARGNDLFFHLEGYPGSHVILRTEGRPDPPPGSLLDACELAVHFSKLKNAGSAEVRVAPIKEVKKPKGVRPGLVYVRKSRTIRLKRNPKRLQSILASRLDDQ